MERYSSYKDSGISWIGEIPEHWETSIFKRLIKYRKVGSWGSEPKTSEIDCTCLRIADFDYEKFRFQRKADNTIRSYKLKDLEDRILKEGDILIEKSGGGEKTPVGRAILYDLNITNAMYANFMEKIAPQDNLISKFLVYMLSLMYSKRAIWNYIKFTTGIQNLNLSSLLSNEKIPLPPLAEQEKIVSYLEDKTSKIDAYVTDKEKEIELLQELKQKTIADAVTKGLNPDAKMKEYYSLISSSCPEHWKIVRNKSIISLTGEKVGKNASEFVLLSLTTKGVIVRDVESGKGKYPKDFDTYQVVKPNELVFCLFDIDETPRTVGLVETEGMLTGAYTAFKVHSELAMPKYIYNYYLCVDNIKALKPYYSGLRKTVRADKFQQIYMPLPPLDEQQAIVAYIEEKCQKIDKLASELQSEIDYLKEYKQHLIADCVTGQINVQNEKT